MVDDVNELLILSKEIARSACQKLSDMQRDYEYSVHIPREMKAAADRILDEEIVGRLKATGLPILSEENGEVAGKLDSGLRFVVDPLDGTVNFVRNLGPSAVSIALYKENNPVFGVLCLYPSGQLAWGGKGMGAFVDDKLIKVSSISDAAKGVLCTGFPSRFQFEDVDGSVQFIQELSHYSKVRMLGAASISLLRVAEGAAEVYMEREIMLWDVAAGLAIVEGAGGALSVLPGNSVNSLNVIASNGVVTTGKDQ